MKVYKIDNGYLLNIDLDEAKLKERKKKYFYYERDGIIIFNFDYNKIKPFVMSILAKKGYMEDIGKKTLMIIIAFLFLFIVIFYLFKKDIDNKVDKIVNILSGANINLDNIDNKKTNIIDISKPPVLSGNQK